ncbi:discoidin domain-containing protein [uncultured Robinsoniella sp.]|uniref:discoidin domain-containing protein n=1 Tax=uncultured Robinsoniella sp. TaxID=904190 RepID=UPI00374F55AB
MRKSKLKSRILSAGLAVCMVGTSILGNAELVVKAAPSEDQRADQKAQEWDEAQQIISQHYGEWDNEDYRGAYSNSLPNTAILGNGDVGVTSAGEPGVKTFLLSKADFWSAGNMRGSYSGAADDMTKPIPIGGVTIQEKSPDAVDMGENLAPGYSEVSCSSYHDDFKPERAVNGTVDQSGYEGWVSKPMSDGTGEWIQVKFEEPVSVQRFVVKNDGFFRPGQDANNTKEMKFQFSDDGESWTDLVTVTDNKDKLIDRNLEEAVTAPYFRVLVTQGEQNPGKNSRARIGQIELYENIGDSNPGEEKNFTLNKPIIVCEQIKDSEGGAKMLDGDQGTKWCSVENHDSPHWAIIDLGEVKDLQSYTLVNAGAGGESGRYNTRDYQIQYLEDETDVTWDNVAEQTGWVDMENVSGNTENIVNKNLTVPANARYVRMLVNKGAEDGDKSHVVRILEFKLSGEVVPDKKPFYEKQDILTAEIQTDMSIADTPVTMETRMQADSNLLITEITSQGAEPAELEVQVWGKADNKKFPAEAKADGNRVTASRTTYNGAAANSKSWTSKAALSTEIYGAANVEAQDRGNGKAALAFTLEPGETIQVVTAIGGGGQTYDSNGNLQNMSEPEDEANALLDSAGDVESLKANHLNWWKDYWMSSYIDMQDNDLVKKYYYGAQYILGSTAREGDIAPGLYGIWHTTDNPSWSSDYHLNYNFISTFYGANSSNRCDLTLPAGEVFLNLEEEGTKRAADVEELRKIDGSYVGSRPELQNGIPDAMLLPVGVGPWGTITDNTYLKQALCAGYSAYPMIEYYKYTKDQDYLNNNVYEYLKKCAAFYETWLEEDENHHYTLYAGYNEGSWAKNPAVELAAVKNLMNSLVDMSQDLGVDADKRKVWKDIYNGLSEQPTTIVNDKKVLALGEKEWKNGQWQDLNNPIPGDGNAIPLDSVIPGDVYNYFSPDQDLEIVRNTVDVFSQRGAWTQINNFPRLFTDAVTARYPAETVIEKLTNTIIEQLQANLRISDNTHGVEKAGATEAINRMFLASADDLIKVYPNWLRDTDAKFVRLRAQNGFLVSAQYNGSLNEAENIHITSEKGEVVNFVVPWEIGAVVRDSEGTIVKTKAGTVPNWEDEKTISFSTTEGETYTVEKAADKTALKDAVDAGKALDSEKYTQNSWKVFARILKQAEKLLTKENVSIEEAEEMIAALEEGKAALQQIPDEIITDKSALKMIVTDSQKIDGSRYTKESWNVFSYVLKEAEKLLDDKYATQEQITKSAAALLDAQASLQVKESEQKPEAKKPGVPKLISAKAVTGKKAVRAAWEKTDGVDGYIIYAKASGGKDYIFAAEAGSQATSYVIEGLEYNKSYNIEVRSYCQDGVYRVYSGLSNRVKAYTCTTAPKAKATAGKRSAALSWKKVSGASGYKFLWKTSAKKKYTTLGYRKGNKKCNYTKKGLKKGKTYYFRVKAYKSINGSKIWSADSKTVRFKCKK